LQIFNGLLLMYNDKFVPHCYIRGNINELHQIFVKYFCVDQHPNIVVVIIPCLCICLQGWPQLCLVNHSHHFFVLKMISIWNHQNEKSNPSKILKCMLSCLFILVFIFCLYFLHKRMWAHNLLNFFMSSRKESTCNENKCNNSYLYYVSL
jgi:hypothetical protein